MSTISTLPLSLDQKLANDTRFTAEEKNTIKTQVEMLTADIPNLIVTINTSFMETLVYLLESIKSLFPNDKDVAAVLLNMRLRLEGNDVHRKREPALKFFDAITILNPETHVRLADRLLGHEEAALMEASSSILLLSMLRIDKKWPKLCTQNKQAMWELIDELIVNALKLVQLLNTDPYDMVTSVMMVDNQSESVTGLLNCANNSLNKIAAAK